MSLPRRPPLPPLPPLPLPLPLAGVIPAVTRTLRRRRRPPVLPATVRTTWRSLVTALGKTAGKGGRGLDADAVGVAVLSAEVRRRGGIVARERAVVGGPGLRAMGGARLLLTRRVLMLEREVGGFLKIIGHMRRRKEEKRRSALLADACARSLPSNAAVPDRAA